MSHTKRLVHSRPRLLIALAVGVAVGLLLPGTWGPITRILMGWDVGAWSYLVLMAWLMARATHAQVKKIAEEEDSTNAFIVLFVLSIAAALSLVAIVIQLAAAKNVDGALRAGHYLFTAATVVGSWLLVVMIYTLHYAHLYYVSPPEHRALKFPDDERNPDYWDFLYFSITIAVAAQTSDICVTNRRMRKAVTAQSLLSFIFNAAIIGMSINIAAGIVGGS